MPHGLPQDCTTECVGLPRPAFPENLVLRLRYAMISKCKSAVNDVAYDEPRPNRSMGLAQDTRHWR